MRKLRKGPGETPELDITTFLNLMVALIPFLLITAVFSHVAILELSIPTGAGAGGANKPNFTIEVVIRSAGFELSNGAQVVAAIPKKDDQYDMETLSALLNQLKDDYPDKEDVTILVEPGIEYDYLIQFMDAVRASDVEIEGSDEVEKRVLFPSISIGDAP